MSNKTRLIIVGAGPSGAAAAYRLLQSKFEDFVILEARDRVGGRIYSLPVGRKHLEIGAQWIHGEEGNDAYDIADAQGLVYDEFAASSSSSDDGNADEDGVDAALSKPICDLASEWRDVMFVTDQGTALPDQIARKMGVVTATLEAEEYGKLWRPLGGAAEEEVKNAGQSFTACLDALVDTEYEELKPWRDPFLNWVNRYMNTVDASDCWTQVSPTYTYHRCPGNPAVAIKPRKGYKGVVEYLLRDVPGDKLILNKEVTDIDWTSETEIKVTCKDGTQYVGEKCLVTLPVGVLRHPNGPKFSPSLPSKKVDALNAIGFGVVDKLFLKFPRRWWPDSAEDGFSLLWTNEEDEEFEGWPRSVLGFYANPGSDRVLCGWISGDAAREMESKSINEVQDVCVRLLRKFTRGLGIKVPDPIQTFRSSWHSDPFARGSYSFRTVDCDEKSLGHADLGEPVPNSDNPRLLFAGEATHPNFYSTVHGAIGSGYREADRVLQTMKATGDPEFHHVVIVGAGISGLAAADTLYRNGIGDVLILEAQDRVGGRVWTVPEERSFLELGAQWIHGDKGNSLFDFSAERDLVDPDSVSYEAEGRFFTSRAEEVEPSLVEEAKIIIRNSYDECNKFSRVDPSLWGEELPTSVGAFFRKKFLQRFDEHSPLHQGLWDWFMLYEKIDNACDTMFELSPISWGEWSDCEGEWHVNLKNGYVSVVDALVECLKRGHHHPAGDLDGSKHPEIRLCEPATRIEWLQTSDSVRAALVSESEGSGLPALAKVTTASGKVYCATHVIVTSSLGFLKERVEDFFSPRLPPKVDLAIRSLGFGVIDKIFVRFPRPFWEEGCRGIHLIWTEPVVPGSSMRDNWVRGISGFDPVVKQPNTLVCWIGGEEAPYMEQLSENDIRLDVWALLKRFTDNQDIPEPVSILRSQWWSNPYARGSYSHRNLYSDSVGVKATDLAEPAFCCDPEDPSFKVPVVMLAGEAQHYMYYSTVHGAFETGQQVAHALVERVLGLQHCPSSNSAEKRLATKRRELYTEQSSPA